MPTDYNKYFVYDKEIEERIRRISSEELGKNNASSDLDSEGFDSIFTQAVETVIEFGQASTSIIQRALKVGYARAGRLIDDMEQEGIVGPHMGHHPRNVLITYDEWLKRRDKYIEKQSCDSNKDGVVKDDTADDKASTDSEYLTLEDYYRDKFGIESDYSDDGYFVNKLDNYVFEHSSGSEQTKLVTQLVRYSLPDTLKLLLIDDGSEFNAYRGIPSLLLPIISNHEKVVGVLSWVLSEMKNRLVQFSECGCKDIASYNETVAENKIPHIVIVINEVYEILDIPNIDDILIPLLLNSKRTGIYLYLFSRFSLKNLSLGVKADLLKVGYSEDLNALFIKDFDGNTQKSLEDIDNMSGFAFERWCGELLKQNGFTKIIVTQSSGDYGADVVAYKDEIKYAIQCKKYSAPVGVSAIQEVIASKSVYDCHIACVITNNTFTPAAVELAKKNLVVLWDRNKLRHLIDRVSGK